MCSRATLGARGLIEHSRGHASGYQVTIGQNLT
ncbi:MAG: hypothetical protein ACI9K5_002593 [Gammaproteobacteria bacterium]